MDNVTLSKDDLFALTGLRQNKSIADELELMGIPFFRRGNGKIVVTRECFTGAASAQLEDAEDREFAARLAADKAERQGNVSS